MRRRRPRSLKGRECRYITRHARRHYQDEAPDAIGRLSKARSTFGIATRHLFSLRGYYDAVKPRHECILRSNREVESANKRENAMPCSSPGHTRHLLGWSKPMRRDEDAFDISTARRRAAPCHSSITRAAFRILL